MSEVKPSQLINSNRAAFWIPGFAMASWGPFIPYVKDRFALTEDHLGVLLMCIAIGAACGMGVASYFINKFGCRTVVRVGSTVLTICLGAVTIIPNYYVLAVDLFIMGFSCEFMSLAANINAGALERKLQRNIMSGLHGVYSLGNTAGVFIVATFLSSGMTFMMGNLLLTSCVFSLAVILYCGLIASRHLLTDLSEFNQQEDKTTNDDAHKHVFMTQLIFMLGMICFIMFMVEGSMMDWTGVLLNQVKGVPMSEAGYGFAAFAFMMTICRLTGDKIVATLGRRRVLVMGAIFAACGIALAVMVPHPMVCLVGFAMVGTGAANLVPQTISYAATERRIPIARSILLVNAIGYIGGLLGPALIGFVAHRIGLEQTFLILACMVLVVAVISYFYVKSGSIAQLTQQAQA